LAGDIVGTELAVDFGIAFGLILAVKVVFIDAADELPAVLSATASPRQVERRHRVLAL
jgi:hypothetical protein